MYGVIVTRTGWHFEYVDDLCLCRAIELLEYWRREAKWQLDAMKKAGKGETREIEVPEFILLDEDAAMQQFQQLPRANPMQPGMEGNIERIPPELREMIDFAEDFKQKRRLN